MLSVRAKGPECGSLRLHYYFPGGESCPTDIASKSSKSSKRGSSLTEVKVHFTVGI